MPEVQSSGIAVLEQTRPVTRQEKLRQDLDQAHQVEQAIEKEVFSLTPTAVAHLKDEAVTEKATAVTSNLRPNFRAEGQTLFRNYAAIEHAIDTYINPLRTGEHTEEEQAAATEKVKQQFFENLFAARGFTTEEIAQFTPEIAGIRINRSIHGTLGFEISPELFQRFAAHTLTSAQGNIDGDIPENREGIASYIRSRPAGIGFVDHITELLPENQIPQELRGADIAFLNGTSPEVIEDLKIYERYKIAEQYKRLLFQQAVPEAVRTRFERRYGAESWIQHALIARANSLITKNSSEYEYLARYGITPEFAQANEQYTEQTKQFYLVSQEINRQLDEIRNDPKFAGVDESERLQLLLKVQLQTKRTQLAADIRSTTSMQQLLGAWTGISEDAFRQQVASVQLTTEDFYGQGQHGRGLLPPSDLKEAYYDLPKTVLPTGEELKFFPHGKYRIVTEVGSGADGRVYKAREVDTSGNPVQPERIVAIKETEIDPKDQEQKETVEEEFHLLEVCRKAHVSNVVGGHEAAYNGNLYYIVEDLIDGETLHTDNNPIPQMRAVKTVAGLYDTLHQLHEIEWEREIVTTDPISGNKTLTTVKEKGILHKDIKDENLMMTKQGTLIITDFGVSRAATRQQTMLFGKHSRKGQSRGTPGYAAAEQYKGLSQKASDVYASGRLLWAMITGVELQSEIPFTWPNPKNISMDKELVDYIQDKLCYTDKTLPDSGVSKRPTAEQARDRLNAIWNRLVAEEKAKHQPKSTTVLPPPPSPILPQPMDAAAKRNFAIQRDNFETDVYGPNTVISLNTLPQRITEISTKLVTRSQTNPEETTDILQELSQLRLRKLKNIQSYNASGLEKYLPLAIARDMGTIIRQEIQRVPPHFEPGWLSLYYDALADAGNISKGLHDPNKGLTDRYGWWGGSNTDLGKQTELFFDTIVQVVQTEPSQAGTMVSELDSLFLNQPGINYLQKCRQFFKHNAVARIIDLAFSTRQNQTVIETALNSLENGMINEYYPPIPDESKFPPELKAYFDFIQDLARIDNSAAKTRLQNFIIKAPTWNSPTYRSLVAARAGSITI